MSAYVLVTLILTALTTYAIKILPFLIFNAKRAAPNIVLYLGRVLSSGVVGMLIVYGIKDGSFSTPPYGLNEILAILSVVVLHGSLRIFVLSVAGGTAVYMFLVQSAILQRLF